MVRAPIQAPPTGRHIYEYEENRGKPTHLTEAVTKAARKPHPGEFGLP